MSTVFSLSNQHHHLLLAKQKAFQCASVATYVVVCDCCCCALCCNQTSMNEAKSKKEGLPNAPPFKSGEASSKAIWWLQWENLRGHHLNNPFISWMSINMKLTGAACLCGLLPPHHPPRSKDSLTATVRQPPIASTPFHPSDKKIGGKQWTIPQRICCSSLLLKTAKDNRSLNGKSLVWWRRFQWVVRNCPGNCC